MGVTGQTEATRTITLMFQLKTDTHDECYHELDEGTTILAQMMICGFILEVHNYGTVRSFRLALHVSSLM